MLETFLLSLLARYAYRFEDPPYFEKMGKNRIIFMFNLSLPLLYMVKFLKILHVHATWHVCPMCAESGGGLLQYNRIVAMGLVVQSIEKRSLSF